MTTLRGITARLRHGTTPLAAAAALVLAATSASAQDISQQWDGSPYIGLELARPSFSDDGFTTFSGLGYLSSMFGSGRTRFLVELPFARGSTEGEFGTSSSLIGSPFVGIARISETEGNGASVSFGVRIPVPESFEFGDDDFAVAIGALGDPDRMEAFYTETVTASGAFRFDRTVNENVLLRAQVDADGLFFLDTSGDTFEAFLGWGGLVRWDGDRAFASGQVTGRVLLTEDEDDRVFHHLAARAGWTFGSAQPFVGVRVPIHGFAKDVVDWTLLLGVQVRLGG